MQILIPILLFALLALLAGVLLSVFSLVFAVEQDERIPQVREALPGANCGACGYAGCDAYAEAVVKNGAPLTACIPGGAAAAKGIGAVMGVEVGEVAVLKAAVRCNGVCGAVTDKYDYRGALSCAASNMLYNGKKTCTAGCLGLGDCVAVCRFDALHIENGVAVVDRQKCTGCGACAKACPNHLIEAFDASRPVEVICSSHFNAKETIKMCKNGCIGCRKCERGCEAGAIKVVDNHAVIDHSLCTGCGKCVTLCPRGCIVRLDGSTAAH